jgi:hypothetical protein
MSPLPAGLVGLGGPEVAVILVLCTIVAIPLSIGFVILKVIRRPTAPNRYCPKCGRGLIQPSDAPFCSYCGNRLP